MFSISSIRDCSTLETTQVSIQTLDSYSAISRNECLPRDAATRLEPQKRSTKRKKPDAKGYVLYDSHLSGIPEKQNHRSRNQTSGRLRMGSGFHCKRAQGKLKDNGTALYLHCRDRHVAIYCAKSHATVHLERWSLLHEN